MREIRTCCSARFPARSISCLPTSSKDFFKLSVSRSSETRPMERGSIQARCEHYRELSPRVLRRVLKAFMPADPTGLFGNGSPTFSSDLKSYVYNYQRITSDLYVVDGLK